MSGLKELSSLAKKRIEIMQYYCQITSYADTRKMYAKMRDRPIRRIEGVEMKQGVSGQQVCEASL